MNLYMKDIDRAFPKIKIAFTIRSSIGHLKYAKKQILSFEIGS